MFVFPFIWRLENQNWGPFRSFLFEFPQKPCFFLFSSSQSKTSGLLTWKTRLTENFPVELRKKTWQMFSKKSSLKWLSQTKLNSERTSFLFKRRSCLIRLADRKKVLQPRLSIKQRGYPRSCNYLFAKKYVRNEICLLSPQQGSWPALSQRRRWWVGGPSWQLDVALAPLDFFIICCFLFLFVDFSHC